MKVRVSVKKRKVALADERIKSLIGDGTVRKVIAVPGRLVNIVVK